MKCKKFRSMLLSLPLLLLPALIYAQSVSEKLEAVYGKEYVQKLQRETPERYDYLLFRMEHVHQLISVREGKSYEELKKVPYYAKKREEKKKISASKLLSKIQDGSFNYMKCQLQRKKSKPTLYELKGTGKVLVLRSEERVAKMYESQR
ncbi:MAG: hypothetical protein ABEH38_07770 [Flavobacteriales bacterium]